MAIRAERYLDDDERHRPLVAVHEQPMVASGLGPIMSVAPAGGSGRRRWVRVGIVAADGMATIVAWVAVMAIFGWANANPLGLLTIALVSAIIGAHSLGLYRGRVSSARAIELRRISALSVRVPVTVLVMAFALHWRPRLGLVVAAVPAMFVCLAGVRSVIDSCMRIIRRQGRFCRHEVIIGDVEEAIRLCQSFDEHPDLGRRVVGVFSDKSASDEELYGAKWLGRVRDAMAGSATTSATGVFLTTSGIDVTTRRQLIEGFHARGLFVHMSPGLFGFSSQNVHEAPILHEPMLLIAPAVTSRLGRATKRAFDIVVSGIMLVLTAPIYGAAALAIKLSSKGPVLFSQNRVGKDGEIFRVLKLRTMEVDAEARLAELQASNERSGPLFKSERDPRVTTVGKMLRASSIDELPQLINVLRGDMSLVGPRPALPKEVAQFDEELTARHLVRPGITGLWQVEARDSPAFGAYRRLDLLYARNWSLRLDIVILVMTAQTVTVRMFDIGWRAIRRRSHDRHAEATITALPVDPTEAVALG